MSRNVIDILALWKCNTILFNGNIRRVIV